MARAHTAEQQTFKATSIHCCVAVKTTPDFSFMIVSRSAGFHVSTQGQQA
jgi:hypothetical protein